MVVDRTPQKEPEDTRSTREKLFAEFEKQSDAFITLAYMYARGYDMVGEDITKAWTNAIRNNQIIEAAYKRGYEDCLKDIENNKRRDFYRKIVYDINKDKDKDIPQTSNNKQNDKGGQRKHGKHKRNHRR